MSLFAAQHVNAGGQALREVQSLIVPLIRTRARRDLADAIRKELAGDRSHDLGFGLTEETLAPFRAKGIPQKAPEDRLPAALLREVETRLASPIATKWHRLVKKYVVAKHGKLRVSDFNEAMLPCLTYESLPLLMRDTMGCVGYPQTQLDGSEQTSFIPDVTLYDGWENRVLRRLRQSYSCHPLHGALPIAMIRWLEVDQIKIEFISE